MLEQYLIICRPHTRTAPNFPIFNLIFLAVWPHLSHGRLFTLLTPANVPNSNALAKEVLPSKRLKTLYSRVLKVEFTCHPLAIYRCQHTHVRKEMSTRRKQRWEHVEQMYPKAIYRETFRYYRRWDRHCESQTPISAPAFVCVDEPSLDRDCWWFA